MVCACACALKWEQEINKIMVFESLHVRCTVLPKWFLNCDLLNMLFLAGYYYYMSVIVE